MCWARSAASSPGITGDASVLHSPLGVLEEATHRSTSWRHRRRAADGHAVAASRDTTPFVVAFLAALGIGPLGAVEIVGG